MRAHILVVDDSAVERRLLEEYLRRAGHEVAVAADAGEALRRLQLHPVDLVVTDLLMPEVDGLELLRRIRTRLPAVPVILVTGNGGEAEAVSALRAGASDYVRKEHLQAELHPAVLRVVKLLQDRRRRQQVESWIVRTHTSFRIGSDRQQVSSLVRRLCELGSALGAIREADEIRVAVALEEALLNAIVHGNLEVSSRLRECEDDSYERMISQRRAHPVYGRRQVQVDCDVSTTEVRYRITDEGPGFNVANLPDPRQPDRVELASGRGVLMMRTFMDEVAYNGRGNEVTLVKRNEATPRPGQDGSCTQRGLLPHDCIAC